MSINEIESKARELRQLQALIEEAQTVAGKQVYVGYTREYVKMAVSSDEPLENTMVSGMITEPIEAEIYEMKR